MISFKRFFYSAAVLAGLSMINMPAKADDTNPNLEKLKEMQAQLAAQGVQIGMPMATQTPEDAYQGEDKDKVLEMVAEAWKKEFPEDEVLGMRIQMDDWERYQDRRWSDGDEAFYDVDYSTLQTMVIVKKDNLKATMWPVNVTKDHMNNEKLEVDLNNLKDTDLMSQDIFLKNLKL
jgi:hypothetical protein